MSKIHSLSQPTLRFDLNLFRVFAAVADLGSTSVAAQQLHLTQSAVSHALKRLRNQVGDPLLVKQGRTLALTPHGRDILPKVQQALEQLTLCQRVGSEFDPAGSDLLFHVGFRDLLEAMLLPRLMAGLEQQQSGIQFASSRVVGSQLEQKLRDGEVDLVVDIEQSVSALIASKPFRSEPLCVVAAKHHPKVSGCRMLMEDYVEASHVLVTLERNERTFVEQRMEGIASKRRVGLYCESYFAAASVVAQTQMLLTMPRSFALQLSLQLPINVVELPFECEPLPVRLYWLRKHSDEAAIRWLIDQVSDFGANE